MEYFSFCLHVDDILWFVIEDSAAVDEAIIEIKSQKGVFRQTYREIIA